MVNVYYFCLPLRVSNNVKVGFWIFSWSCWVVERLFPKNPKFLEIGNQVYISHLQQTGEYQTGPDCQTFYQSPNIHSIHSIPNIHRRWSASTPSDIHNLVSISTTFSSPHFFLIESLIIAINIFAVVHYPKILKPYFPNLKSCPQILLTFCASLTWNRNCPPLFNLKFFQAAARVWRRSALEIKIRFLGSPPGNFKTSHSPLSGLWPGLLAQGRDHKMKMATKQRQFAEIRIFSIHAEWFTLFPDWIFPNSRDFARF